MFAKAIVRVPCKNLVNGITSSPWLGSPDYEAALKQHENYRNILKNCGLDVTILEPDEHFPDSVFVEDTALLTLQCAIITNPGAVSRKGETKEMLRVLEKFYKNIESVNPPGTIEAGDVMMAEDHFFIGISGRTNDYGADQVINILEKYGFTGSKIHLQNMLHLKSGVSYLGRKTLLAVNSFLEEPQFKKYNIITVDDHESYAANSLWINDKVIIPQGYPLTKKKIRDAGFITIEADVSEFRKLDGGLSCLSLRF